MMKYPNLFFTMGALLFSCLLFSQRVVSTNNKGTKLVTGNIVTEAATQPTTPTPIQGDFWMDTTTNTTKIWDGNSWEPISPSSATTLVFIPEYAGAVLSADGTDNVLNMVGGTSGAPSFVNYYQISNFETDGGTNDYDIVLGVKIPDDFDSWTTGTVITIDYEGTTDANFDADVYERGNGTPLKNNSPVSGTGLGTFTQYAIASDTDLTALVAGDVLFVSIKITITDVATEDASIMRLGEITLNYTKNH